MWATFSIMLVIFAIFFGEINPAIWKSKNIVQALKFGPL